jgi:histidinol dehydrogenase
VVNTLDEAYELADEYASEHVEILTGSPGGLRQDGDYDAFFLGDKTCASYGDKVSLWCYDCLSCLTDN